MKTNKPDAYCILKGSREYRNLKGIVYMIQKDNGVLIKIHITGFPVGVVRCNQPIASIHIHEGTRCTGTRENPFQDALAHYNPNNCDHPYHAGDLGNLFINKDRSATLSMINDRFTIKDVLNKTMILHYDFDDFKTQPNGNSGERIACGIILKYPNN